MPKSESMTSSNEARLVWPDYAKGIGIFLVVAGHVLRGLVKSSIIPGAGIVGFVDAWIYSFHMSLFFFISGMFAPHSAKKSFDTYTLDKLKGVAYPYFVWCLIQGLIQIGLSSYTTSTMGFVDLWAVLYRPPAQFWFLYVLFVIMIMFGAMKKLGVKDVWFFLFSIAFFFSIELVYLGPWGVIYMVRENMIYFGLGVLLSTRIKSISHGLNTSGRAYYAFPALMILTLCVWFRVEQFLPLRPLLAVFGIFSIVAIAISLSSRNTAGVIRKWGTVSLQIYVAHTIASAGFRVVIHKILGYEAAWLHIIGGILVGMYFPIFLDGFCRRIRFKYLFTLR